jgi:hypothetical protein
MKSLIRTFVLPGVAAASKRPMTTTEPNRNRLGFRFKTSHLFLLLGLIAPVQSFASDYCIAVAGGFSDHGTTFIGSGFAVPGEGKCAPWSGFTKHYFSVLLTTTGTGCLSSDGKVLTVSVSSADPAWLGTAPPVSDYIQLSRGDSQEPFKGYDNGAFGYPAESEAVTCTSDLLSLPASHD